MKEIKCFIRPEKLDGVLNALHGHADLPGVTSSPVQGFGRSRPTEPASGLCGPMVKLEIVVEDDQVEAVKRIIAQNAQTGRAGDGMLFVSPIEESVRIRPAPSTE